MKNLIYKTIVSVAILTAGFMSFAPANQVKADGNVTTTICTTVTGIYGNQRVCRDEITGFVSNEIIAASTGMFALGIGLLLVNNYVRARLNS